MAERVVRVKLTAQVQEYSSAMKEAANATRAVGSEAERLRAYKDAFNTIGMAGLAMGGLIATGLAVAVKRTAEFDHAMSAVNAATHASAESMDQLRDAALSAGESTVFSASEAANAIEELAKAGVSTADVLGGGLKGSLDLAAAGNLGVADAAGIAATALKMFNLQGGDMSHVADLLSAGAGKAMGDVSDLSQALNQAGLVANGTGLSIEETTATLAAFAEQGLMGSDAGTSFKSMLQRLTPQSAEAESRMKELGISAYDAAGNFVGMAKFAGNLRGALEHLTPQQRNSAMATIFGSDAVRAAGVVYAQGEEGIRDWISAVDDQGYAADTARRRLDNLKGDLEELGGAFETALINTGSAANDTLRTMAQALTGLVGMYNDLPAPIQATVTAVGGATAAIALSGGAAMLAVPKYLELRNTVQLAGMSMKGIGLTAGAAGLALGGLFVIVGELAAQHQRARERAQAYADSIDAATGKVTEAARATAITELQKGGELLSFNWQSAYDAAQKLGVGADTVTDAALKNVDAIDELSRYYAALSGDQEEFNKLQQETGMNAYELRFALEAMTTGIGKQNSAIDDAVRLKEQESDANAGAVKSSDSASESYMQQADAIADLNTQMTDLISRINEANGVAVDAITSNANYLAAMDGLAAQAERLGLSLDETTVAGSANAAAMGEISEKAREAADAQYIQDRATMSSEEAVVKYNQTLAAQKQAFIDSAVQAGYNAAEVQALADRIFQLPTEREFEMLVETAEAQQKIDGFITTNTGRRVKVYVDTEGGTSYRVGGITVSPGMARGGPVVGPGPKGVDSELRMLAPGEHVLTAAEVDAAGGHAAVMDWRQMVTAGRTEEATWVRGSSGSAAVVAESSAVVEELVRLRGEVAALNGSLGRPNLTFNNPVSRDAKSDAWEAAQIMGVE